MKNTQILRALAREYYKIAKDDSNAERIRLHKASNGLKMIRPVVLIDELPWSEMNIGNELTLLCTDPYLREIEQLMRQEIYRFKHLRADMIVRPFIPILKVVHSSGIGIGIKENVLPTDATNNIVSHQYEDQLSCEADLEKLHKAIITYDEVETNRRYQLVGEILGDIIPVKKVGIDYLTMHPWDDIAMYRGVMPLLIDLAENPEFCHRMIRKITDISMDIMEQYRSFGLFENNPWSLHCTPILCDELHNENFDGEHVGYENLWGRGTAQIFASVSKDMHEEFDIQYMKDTIGKCGLVYYGCCEPLDRKIDIVEKIPNLRKVSITPWADVQVAAEVIGKKYVLASKPNPSAVSVSKLDQETLKKEIGNILSACKKNGCSCDIVFKDISTCCKRPENIFEWEKIAMDMVRNF